MTQKFLYHDDRNAVFQKVCGIRMPQRVGVNVFGDACFFRDVFYYPLHTALAVAGIEIFTAWVWRINLFNISVMVSIE